MCPMVDFLLCFFQKRKADELKPNEEKVKKLKKRNAELAAIARRLEEKAKQLQQNSKVRKKDIKLCCHLLGKGDKATKDESFAI